MLRPHYLNEGPLIEGGAKMVPLQACGATVQMPTNCTSPVSTSVEKEIQYNLLREHYKCVRSLKLTIISGHTIKAQWHLVLLPTANEVALHVSFQSDFCLDLIKSSHERRHKVGEPPILIKQKEAH